MLRASLAALGAQLVRPGALAVLVLGSGLAVGQAAPPVDDPFPPAAPESVGLSSEALEELAAEVAQYVERDLTVGAELLVIQDRRTVLHSTFGMADREGEEPWEIGTVANIRSMTKPLTGAAAQLLIDRGQLALDDPVATYLPGFDTDAARDITVRHLLTHRAGLPLTILTDALDAYPDLRAFGDAVGAAGPEFEVDSRFWYSDAGTEALGAVVEVASGRPLGEFVHDELLVPLGMADTFYFVDDEDPRRARISSLYIGGAGRWERFLDPDEGSFYPFPWGSQSLYSTPRDYARFLAMWMDQGHAGDGRLLSPEAIERTLTPVSEMSMLGSDARFPTSYTGLEVWYGQMSVLHVPRGSGGAAPATIVGHSGSDGTIAWAWPDLDLMVLYFTQSRGGGSALRLEEVVDRLLVSPGAYVHHDVPEDLRPLLGSYVADWSSHMLEELTVEHRNGRLILDVPSQLAFELQPLEVAEGAEPRWGFAIMPAIEVWFGRDAEGRVDRLHIKQEPLTFEAPRKGSAHAETYLASVAVRADDVGHLLGRYRDPESDADVEVFVDGRYLAVRNPEDQVFHLWQVPVRPDTWQVRENPVVSLRFEEQDGRVVSMDRRVMDGDPLVMPRVEDPPEQ